jgi:hypothetical protein
MMTNRPTIHTLALSQDPTISENAGRLANSGFLFLVQTVTNKITDRLPPSTGVHRAGRFLFGRSERSEINNTVYNCFIISIWSRCKEEIERWWLWTFTWLRGTAALQTTDDRCHDRKAIAGRSPGGRPLRRRRGTMSICARQRLRGTAALQRSFFSVEDSSNRRRSM